MAIPRSSSGALLRQQTRAKQAGGVASRKETKHAMIRWWTPTRAMRYILAYCPLGGLDASMLVAALVEEFGGGSTQPQHLMSFVVACTSDPTNALFDGAHRFRLHMREHRDARVDAGLVMRTLLTTAVPPPPDAGAIATYLGAQAAVAAVARRAAAGGETMTLESLARALAPAVPVVAAALDGVPRAAGAAPQDLCALAESVERHCSRQELLSRDLPTLAARLLVHLCFLAVPSEALGRRTATHRPLATLVSMMRAAHGGAGSSWGTLAQALGEAPGAM